ncbi:response regulator [Mameliella alba]|nr:response regulator [Antarctobacter heliothermus]MBY6146590.1 response regulator [Mameliella alba]MCA0956268.1 response regulator [Mameliella alba]
MNAPATSAAADRVSRRRYERERAARKEAEHLLEEKSRALFDANAALKAQAAVLEEAVRERTRELETAKTAAESASTAKSGFLAMISHEIRTPLNGVLGMATTLVESDLAPEQQEMAEIIQSCGISLLDLLNDLLDLSKIEAHKMEMEERDFDLDALCHEVLQVYEPRAESKGLKLDVTQDAAARGWLRSDPTRLRQVITNLVSNALKFTAKGGVYVAIRRIGEVLEIQVRDTGPGVPPDKRDRLFEAFTQTDASITRKFGGTGLGLTISRRICRLLGGDLVYEPAPAGGSVFVARLRVEDARSRNGPDRDSQDQADAVLMARPWRILVAEDSETNQRVLRLLLRRYPFRIDVVGDGAAAVEAHCSAPFDLILMDVNMPEMNGLEAAAMIREVEAARELPRVPIVALTANAMTHQVSSYLRNGIDAHVAKPIKREALAAVMARLLTPQAE